MVSDIFGGETLELQSWCTPATSYYEKQVGSFRIKRTFYPRGYYRNWGIDGYLFFHVNRRIPIMVLQEKRGGAWHSWMVDDPPQYRAMQIYCEQASGDVLCAGLGLGLMAHELCKNKAVRRVVVIELNQEVISLTSPYMPKKVEIVRDDFFSYIHKDTNHWGMILVDLWVSSGREEKLKLIGEVAPIAALLKITHPQSKIVFHGFTSFSDVSPILPNMIERALKVEGELDSIR